MKDMLKEKLFLGIDTSCYTTSVAALDESGVKHFKKMLDVKKGDCGLRQSDAVFQHIKNLPRLFDELKEKVTFSDYEKIVVSVSARPRNIENSYMPVFLAGQSFAKVIADVLSAEYLEVSHQDGHIMAAIHSCDAYDLLKEPFLTYHMSGGTTELLLVRFDGKGFLCDIVGGTKDIPAGQFIDRIGVQMGLDFPCGKYIDAIATEYSGKKPKVKTCVSDCFINFSGEETRYRRLLEDGVEKEEVAYCVMNCIAESVRKSVIQAKEKYGVQKVLMVGGVSSSRFIRNFFADVQDVYFAAPELSTDNAVGVCKMGERIFYILGNCAFSSI